MTHKLLLLVLAIIFAFAIAQDPTPQPTKRLALEAIASKSDISHIRTNDNTNIISSSNWLATPDQINWTGALAEETPETLAIRKRLLSKLFGKNADQIQ